MRSLRQQMLVLLVASLVLLAGSLIFILGLNMRERAISAAIIKAQSDLATCTEITNLKYPGDWHVENGSLFKGTMEISGQNEMVDALSALTGDSVTFFLNDTRVATTVRGPDGKRAVGTKVSDAVAQQVLQKGEVYLGEANVVGQIYQTAYEPLRDRSGNILGIFYVGISRSYTQAMIVNSLWQTAALGGFITLIVGLLTWFLIERVIIRPLRHITLGTRDLAADHVTEKVRTSGPKEIGELASAFNQMIERLETITKGLEQRASFPEEGRVVKNVGAVEESVPLFDTEDQEDQEDQTLPKGLNKATLKQITDFLGQQHDFVSAEDVADGVKLTRVTVRRYLDFLEHAGTLTSKLKYGTVGRPVRIWINKE